MALAVGDILTLGSWDGEPLGWRVLEISPEGDRALVITNKVVDRVCYQEPWRRYVTWADCSLRRWLNDEFYSAAFDDADKRRILLTDVENADNPEYGTPGGESTQDRLFCLSIDEVRRYFEDSREDRRAEATAMAWRNGIFIWSHGGGSDWWLRSPGYREDMAACVDYVGNLSEFGLNVHQDSTGARPAMWVERG